VALLCANTGTYAQTFHDNLSKTPGKNFTPLQKQGSSLNNTIKNSLHISPGHAKIQTSLSLPPQSSPQKNIEKLRDVKISKSSNKSFHIYNKSVNT